MVLIYCSLARGYELPSLNRSHANLVASAAVCAALYTVLNAITATIHTPWGVGEFRPGVVIPAFFAVVSGPLPAALGAAVGSFLGDMIALVPTGGTTPLLALVAGVPGNFVGFYILGWVFQKVRTWRGFIVGTTSGLFIGNLIAAVGVVLFLGLSNALILGLVLFWFGTMFPFVVIFVPVLVRYLRPYASGFSSNADYPVITEPNRRILWGWSILVSVLVLAALGVLLLAEAGIVENSPGGAFAFEALFGVAAASVIVVGAFIPRFAPEKPKIKTT